MASLGHTIYDLRGSVQEGIDDLHAFRLAQEHRAMFFTTDKDFFHTLPRLIPEHHGVVVVALRKPNGQMILDRLMAASSRFLQQDLSGQAVLITDTTVLTIRSPRHTPSS